MKFFPSNRSVSRYWLAVFVVAASAIALRAELTKWTENIDAGSRLENVFFRTVVLPGGSVPARRPPKETRPELTKLIAATPGDAELYSLRALEDEQQLDFAAAEADWKKFVDLSADKGAAKLALADYYHRRLQSNPEFEALAQAAAEPAPAAEKLLPDAQQRPWKTYERLIKLVDEQRLDPMLGVGQYRLWTRRFPAAPGLQQNFFAYAVAHKLPGVERELIDAYEKAFPKDEEFPVEARSELAVSTDQALAVYERSFRPLWPPQLVTQYFALLKKNNALRAYLARARAGVAANPLDLASVVRLFYYWQQQGNPASAEGALAEFQRAKDARQSPWTSEELLTLARLFESSHNYDEAARELLCAVQSCEFRDRARLSGAPFVGCAGAADSFRLGQSFTLPGRGHDGPPSGVSQWRAFANPQSNRSPESSGDGRAERRAILSPDARG